MWQTTHGPKAASHHSERHLGDHNSTVSEVLSSKSHKCGFVTLLWHDAAATILPEAHCLYPEGAALMWWHKRPSSASAYLMELKSGEAVACSST